MKTYQTNVRHFVLLMLCMFGVVVCRAQDRLPEEMAAVVKAYSIGKLSADHLQGVCRWGSARKGANAAMTQVRTQAVAFCDGYLAATVDFARLDSSNFQTLTTARPGNVLSCKNLTAGSPRAQFLASPDFGRMQSVPASEFLLDTLFACMR